MWFKRVVLITVILFLRLPLCYGQAEMIQINGQTYSFSQLQAHVELLLRSGNVELRRHIEVVFVLAELYEKRGQTEEAIALYDKALEVDAWNLGHQLRLAGLLKNTDRKQEAISKAQLVYEYAEKEDLLKDAESLLLGMGVKTKSPMPVVSVNKNVEIVLIPLGEVDTRALSELENALQNKIGINFSISNTKKDIGYYDRDQTRPFVNTFYTRIKELLPSDKFETLLSELKLTPADLELMDNQKKFIYAFFNKLGSQGENERKAFNELLAKAGKEGQYNIARLRGELKREYPLKDNTPVKGYLAVTGEDIYEGSSNYRFGGALPGYAVVSYNRFTALFNHEDQNRPRLIKRALKQAVTSSFFVLGIPRCTNPVCIRAYPHSLQELDTKGDEICDLCKSKLKAYQSQING